MRLTLQSLRLKSQSEDIIHDTAAWEAGLAQRRFLTGVRDNPVQRANQLERSAAAKAVPRPIAALTATREHEEMRILFRVGQQACCTKQILWGPVTQAQGEPKRLGWVRSICASHFGPARRCGQHKQHTAILPCPRDFPLPSMQPPSDQVSALYCEIRE